MNTFGDPEQVRRDTVLSSANEPSSVDKALGGVVPAQEIETIHPPLSAGHDFIGRDNAAKYRTRLDLVTTEPERMTSGVSLASSIMRANDADSTRPVVFIHNYTSANLTDDGRLIPFHVAPTPVLDFPMCYFAVSNSGPAEHIVTLELPPGFEEYLRESGLLHESTKVIQVPAMIDPAAPEKLGFPFTDVLSACLRSGTRLPEAANLAVTFPSQLVREQAASLGVELVQQSDPSQTNNKALFRAAAERFAFRVAPGMEIHSEDHLREAATRFSDSSRVWVKLSHGAGGDTVKHVDAPITEYKLGAAVLTLRRDVQQAFARADFSSGVTAEEYWPEDSFAPTHSTITVEQDIGDMGEILMNLSNAVVINKSGPTEILAYFEQHVDDNGAFLGGAPVFLEPEVRTALDAASKKVGEFARELSLFGHIGLDFYLVRLHSGEIAPVFIEMNGRPSSNMNTKLVADKVGAPYWINTSLVAPEPLKDFEDVRRILTRDGESFLERAPHEGRVMVMGLSTAWQADPVSGVKAPVVTSSAMRVVIASTESQSQCLAVLEQLRALGLKPAK